MPVSLNPNPTKGERRILGNLMASGPMTATELATRIGTSVGSVRAQLSRLMQSGRVGKQPQDTLYDALC